MGDYEGSMGDVASQGNGVVKREEKGKKKGRKGNILLIKVIINY